MAFFISLSLSITASGVDLPVAFLQPPSQRREKPEWIDSHLTAGESKRMNIFHSFSSPIVLLPWVISLPAQSDFNLSNASLSGSTCKCTSAAPRAFLSGVIQLPIAQT